MMARLRLRAPPPPAIFGPPEPLTGMKPHPRGLPRLTALALLVAAACGSEPVVETEPVAVTPPTFEYPEELWEAGVQGCALLRLRVTGGGVVDSSLVERASGYPAFDSAALAGVGGLRFEPATRDGSPTDKWVLLPVEFGLTPEATPCSDNDPAPDP
jgi:periplasmic protein TonB